MLPIVNRKKRRKLHGVSAKRLKDTLAGLSQKPLEVLLETRDPNAYLCNQCEKQLDSLVDLEAKLTATRLCIVEKLSSLHLAPGGMGLVI